MTTNEIAEANIKRWRETPRGILAYWDEVFGFIPDKWQENAGLAFASKNPDYRRISLQACVGPGKTAVLAGCGWHFLTVQGDELDHPQGACTAITGDNLRDNLWKEFAKWQDRSPMLTAAFTITSKRIFSNSHPKTWFMSARTYPKTANQDTLGATLSGLHSKYVLILGDEAGAMHPAIGRAAEQALAQASGGVGKIVIAGNPVSLEGWLHEVATTLRHLWHVIRITGDPDDPNAWVYSPRVGDAPLAWAKEQIATYGRENPWVKSYILGQFPPQSINSLLGIEDVEAAMARHYKPDAFEWAQKRIGIDVARFGDDRTVLFPRQGLVAFAPVIMRQQNTVAIAGRAAQGMVSWFGDQGLDGQAYVDDTGHWGHGVIDNLSTAGYPVMGIVFSDPAINARYANRRAEIWMEMAKWIKGGGALPRGVRELIKELTTPTYTFNMAGKIVLEEKAMIKKRLGSSPDIADALALTFSQIDMPAGMAKDLGRQPVAQRDHDPYTPPDSSSSSIAQRDHDPYASNKL